MPARVEGGRGSIRLLDLERLSQIAKEGDGRSSAPKRASKQLELEGWPYPRHLAGRAFSVVVHGDAAGVERLRDSLTNWLTDMELIAAGHLSQHGAYVGYMRPYATSHDDLDQDADFQEEVRNAARALAAAVKQLRRGELTPPDAGLRSPRPK